MTKAAMNYLYSEHLLSLSHEYEEALIVLHTDSSGRIGKADTVILR